MFSTGQKSTLQGTVVMFSGCTLWKANCTGGMCPKQDTAPAVKSMQPETRTPGASGTAGWQKELCTICLWIITSSVSLPVCQQRLGAVGISRQTELGKRETGNSWLPAQASNQTAILCISVCIWTGVLSGVIFKICVFTQGPVLYIACLLMLSCCARSLLSRRSAFLTHFVIILSHLLLVKGLAVSSWYSTEFAIHYISNNF